MVAKPCGSKDVRRTRGKKKAEARSASLSGARNPSTRPQGCVTIAVVKRLIWDPPAERFYEKYLSRSTSANCERSKTSRRWRGTVQSKMVLHVMPGPRSIGLYSGVAEGSRE